MKRRGDYLEPDDTDENGFETAVTTPQPEETETAEEKKTEPLAMTVRSEPHNVAIWYILLVTLAVTLTSIAMSLTSR